MDFFIYMGAVTSILKWAFTSGKKASILILGLDASGKTTLLYRLKHAETYTTIPTIGFNAEEITHGRLTFTCFDIGGQDKIRKLWHHYFANTDAIVFVVDASDRERFVEAKVELDKLFNHPSLTEVPFLIFANKQDLPGACRTDKFIQELGLKRVRRKWKVAESTATQGTGIEEGFDWLSEEL